jgi:hypothetical protein
VTGVVRTGEEMRRQMYAASRAGRDGNRWVTRWPGTTFEQGVHAALQWATGETDEPPVAEPS